MSTHRNLFAAAARGRRRGIGVLAAFVVLFVGVATQVRAADDKSAPEFALRSLDGQNLRLSELRGEVVMINFWASWCGACRSAMPSLNELNEKYRRVGLKLLSVNVDDEQHKAEHMSDSLRIRFPVLRDEQKAVSKLYRADTLPLTVLIDREGKVRYSHTGYNVGDEKKFVAELHTLLNE